MSKEEIEGTPTDNTEGEPEQVTVTKAELEQLRKDSEDKKSLVSEIKDLREKKQLSESEKAELEQKIEELKGIEAKPDQVDPTNINEIINQQLEARLSQQQKLNREQARTEALEKFKRTHKEFHDENDEAGLKMSAFERKLQRFNLDSASSVDDFQSIFEDAYALMGRAETTTSKSQLNDQAATPPNEGGDVPSEDELDKELSSEEKQLIESTFGGDKERYLVQRNKRPDYIAQLLHQSRQYRL